jgi:hypothetical protein
MDIITYKNINQKTNKSWIEFESFNNKENNNIIKYLKSNSWKIEIWKTEKLLNNILI